MNGTTERAAATSGAASPASAHVELFDRLFHARSVAMVGISADAGKLTGAPLRNLLKARFDGPIYLVNPKYEKIGDIDCYPSVQALPAAPDVALIMLAAEDVPQAVRALGEKGTRTAVVLSSGFEESEEGAGLARELAAAAAECGMVIVGPNCEGLWSVRERMVLTFGSAANRDTLHHAPVAIISQSGAIAGSISRHLQDSGFGCSYVVSVGNETVCDALDFTAWAIEQDDVKVVLLFIEGLKRGARLLGIAARAAERGIRLVALKSGNSPLGQLAASSHTGKIASPNAIYTDILEQAGVIQVDRLVDLIEAAEVLTYAPSPRHVGSAEAGLVVFSIPGGTRAMTADLCHRLGVPMATFAKETEAALGRLLPGFAQVANPTDLTGQVLTRPQLFEETLAVVADDPNAETMIIQLANRGPRDLREKNAHIVRAAKKSGMPVVVSFLGDVLPAEERHQLLKSGVIPAREPADAVRYLSWLYKFRQRAAPSQTPTGKAHPADAPTAWPALVALLEGVGIGVPETRVIEADADIAATAQMQFPLVVKAMPDQAEHKTELGLVELGIGSRESLDASIGRIRDRLGDKHAPVLVQQTEIGVEAVLSVIDDPDFGPVLCIGSGGVGVELWGDVGFVALPASEEDLRRVIAGLKLDVHLRGFRGKPPADRDALVAAATRLGTFMLSARGIIAEVEINPLFVKPVGAGVVAADILVRPARGDAE